MIMSNTEMIKMRNDGEWPLDIHIFIKQIYKIIINLSSASIMILAA